MLGVAHIVPQPSFALVLPFPMCQIQEQVSTRVPNCLQARAVLNGKKTSVPLHSVPKKARGHAMCSTMVGGGWRVAVGGWRQLAVGSWQLAVGGGWWWLVVGGWWLVVGGWWRLVVVGSWRLVAAGGWRGLVAVAGWRLVVGGSWRLAVGDPLGRSLRAVLNKKKNLVP